MSGENCGIGTVITVNPGEDINIYNILHKTSKARLKMKDSSFGDHECISA